MNTTRLTVLLLFVGAIAVRSVMMYVFADDLIVGSDLVDYINLSHSIAAGDFVGMLDTYWPPFFPLLLGLADVFIDGLVAPAVVVAILTGSLAVPMIYYFVRQSYGHSEGVTAAVLAIFYPHLLNSVFSLGSENVYLLLITASLFTGWKALTSETGFFYTLTGALVGLAYLTRPEAFAYPAFFLGAPLFRNLWKREQFSARSLRFCGAFLIAFLVLAAPYLIYLKNKTGEWTISSKTEINTVMGDYDHFASPNEEGVTEPTVSVETGAVLLRLVGLNMVEINKSIPYLVPFAVTVFASLGLFATVWGADRTKRELYLIGFCLLTVFGYAATVVQTRYFYILLPIVLGWTAKGIWEFGRWSSLMTHRLNASPLILSWPRYVPALCVGFLFLYLLPLNSFTRSRESAWHDRPYEERAAGVWLKQNVRTGATIFSARKLPAFYGGVAQVPPKTPSLDSVLSEIRTTGVEYVVAGTRGLKRNPYLEDLEGSLERTSEFEKVYSNADHPQYKIAIFKRR